jgi:hypothetical protein
MNAQDQLHADLTGVGLGAYLLLGNVWWEVSVQHARSIRAVHTQEHRRHGGWIDFTVAGESAERQTQAEPNDRRDHQGRGHCDWEGDETPDACEESTAESHRGALVDQLAHGSALHTGSHRTIKTNVCVVQWGVGEREETRE